MSIACTGALGCPGFQVCNADGSGYGPCACASDGGILCVPGQSIQCVGPYGCVSYQVCDATGKAYEPCVCAEGGSDYGDGGVPDGWAPLPPPVGDQGYNAFWAYDGQWSANAIYLPLFSAPDCAIVPPYGEYYFVIFEPSTTGPAGTFPSCPSLGTGGSPACYAPARESTGSGEDFVGGGANLSYTLSAFDANGIATGQMNTTDGLVPLVVKNCP